MKKKLFRIIAITSSMIFLFCSPMVVNADTKIYRLYNPNLDEHFYTRNVTEVNGLVNAGWRNEGVGWVAPDSGGAVYRLYNPNTGVHHYTSGAGERDSLVRAGWRYEQISFYTGGSIPVYRAYKASIGRHNLTSALAEQNNLIAAGWNNEGVAFYGVATASNGTVNAALYIHNPYWNLVISGHMTINATASSYNSYVQTAISKWNILRPGTISSSTSSAGNSVIASDVYEVNNYYGTTYSNGRITFNNYNLSSANATIKTVVATHELGHALGLGHLPVYEDLMYYIAEATANPNISTQNVAQFREAAKRY